MDTSVANVQYKAKRWELSASLYIYSLLAGCGALYVYIMYCASGIIAHSSSHVSARSYFETHLIMILMQIVIWYILARAAMRLKSYARDVIGSVDGQGLNYIANALLVSLFYAITFGMASTIKTLFWHTPYLHLMTTVTNLRPLAK